jgi:hypothetical protein
MARGDGGETVFENDGDRLVFLSRLGEACGSCGWRVHAWVLMGKGKSGIRKKDSHTGRVTFHYASGPVRLKLGNAGTPQV